MTATSPPAKGGFSAERFFAWLASAEGEAALRRHAEETERYIAKLGATRHIPHEVLHAEFNI